MKVKHNLNKHEIIGLFLVFMGASCFGAGLYYIVRSAIIGGNLFGKDIFIFPALFGIGILIYELGKIELKEIPPGKRRL
jgi:hypothetical protein